MMNRVSALSTLALMALAGTAYAQCDTAKLTPAIPGPDDWFGSSMAMKNGVLVVGDSALPASIPKDASAMYSKNVINFLKLFFNKNAEFNLNFDDDIIAAACVAHQGKLVSERMKQSIN